MKPKKEQVSPNEDWDITVTGRHVAVTDAMKQYAIDKITKLERFSLRIVEVHVTMDIQKLGHSVDIIMKINNFRLKSHMTSENMYASIDGAVDKVQRQIRRYKKRLQEHHARGLSDVDMTVNVVEVPDEITDINDEIEDETIRRIEDELAPHPIVKRETRPLKILTNEEAVMKMELSGYEFIVFRHEENNKIKVIYRRQDGNYGIIEPE